MRTKLIRQKLNIVRKSKRFVEELTSASHDTVQQHKEEIREVGGSLHEAHVECLRVCSQEHPIEEEFYSAHQFLRNHLETLRVDLENSNRSSSRFPATKGSGRMFHLFNELSAAE